jgi:dTDP-4-amino-4,6-dideoxygalactose transaminase
MGVLSEVEVILMLSGKLPKVVVPVHLSGQSCDMAAIHALSQHDTHPV